MNVFPTVTNKGLSYLKLSTCLLAQTGTLSDFSLGPQIITLYFYIFKVNTSDPICTYIGIMYFLVAEDNILHLDWSQLRHNPL